MSLISSTRIVRGSTATSESILIVGDTYVGSTIARRIGRDADVRLVTDHDGVAAHARNADVSLVVSAESAHPSVTEDVSVLEGELLSEESLREAGIGASPLAILAMADDSRALLAAQLLRTQFDGDEIVAVLTDPRAERAFEDVTVETVCLPHIAASTVESIVSDRLAARQNA